MNAIIKAYTLSECMDAMAEYVEAYEKTGGVNLVFCEDRLTLIAERAVVKRLGGTFSTSISTFTRFLKTDAKTVTKQGSVMIVGEVMTALQRENKLKCFTTLSGIGNNARCIYETLAQFSASAITPSLLKSALGNMPEDSLQRKISDLALVYEGYQSALQERACLDESAYLSLLPARIRKEGVLKGVNVFFLCYTSFTKQAQELIRAVLETADNVVGVFCAGEEDLYTNGAVNTFERVCNEYGGAKILPLGQPLDGTAEGLRQCLFNPETPEKKTVTDKIHVFEADDKTSEAEFVATKIRRVMQENTGMRYRDIAVLTPDVPAYSLALKKAFAEYKIPYFIDEKRSLKSHPLSRFLLDCFRVVKEKYSPSSVQSLTQNFFFGESDEYRNYLLKYANYRYGAKRPIKTDEAVVSAYDYKALDSGRERFLSATGKIKAEGHGREYCEIVRMILRNFDADEKLKALEDSAYDLAQKGYLEQIGGALNAVLVEAEALMGDKKMTATEFATVLEDGLGATEISLIPLKADAVFIGDITDSRIEKVRVLFAMGMTDDVPKNAVDTAMISDAEIQRLGEVQAKLEPTVEEVNRRARECVALNLCTFLDGLYLSYPLKADGDEPQLSEIFRYIKDAFVGADHHAIQKQKGVADADFAFACSAYTPAVRNLLTEKNLFEKKRVNEKIKYSSLVSALDKLGVWKDGEFIKEGGHVSIERGEALFFHAGKTSPTSLEGYFVCPFKNFAQRGLAVKERDETTVVSVDTGNFVHQLLQEITPKIETLSSEEDMRAFALVKGEELLKKSAYAMQQDVDSGVYFSENLVKEGAEIAVAVYRQIKGSDFKVEQLEGYVDGGFFHGKVDRFDGTEKYVRVVDYKTGRIDDSANSYYVGKKIQLQLYASALKGERIPAGVFYFPAVVDYGEGDYRERFRMQGFMNGDEDALRTGDKSITETEKSEFFPTSLKPSASTKRVMDGETFRDFLDYAVLVARRGEKELKEGFIAPSPYDKACQYCKYGGMCGFDKELCKPRKEATIDPKTIANIAKEERDGED